MRSLVAASPRKASWMRYCIAPGLMRPGRRNTLDYGGPRAREVVMLEHLDEIDWDGLTHAYGNAGDIPELIRALASRDPDDRENAIDALYDALCHQVCTIYEAT